MPFEYFMAGARVRRQSVAGIRPAHLGSAPLVPLTVAFFAGRLVSYSLYVAGASAVRDTFGDVIVDSLRSPVGIALQVAMLVAVVALVRVDWVSILGRRRGSPVSSSHE